ncbi:hypothetical protein RRG08_012959 [Elysia crispata]|uniref:Uncharacterized protein n=1 Tax=Elysia crispata TaxID=231223 RepID=A0AAE1A147_9GAST|nr:hypothetical protein RRG08_012959 [Elysia crispata]
MIPIQEVFLKSQSGDVLETNTGEQGLIQSLLHGLTRIFSIYCDYLKTEKYCDFFKAEKYYDYLKTEKYWDYLTEKYCDYLKTEKCCDYPKTEEIILHRLDLSEEIRGLSLKRAGEGKQGGHHDLFACKLSRLGPARPGERCCVHRRCNGTCLVPTWYMDEVQGLSNTQNITQRSSENLCSTSAPLDNLLIVCEIIRPLTVAPRQMHNKGTSSLRKCNGGSRKRRKGHRKRSKSQVNGAGKQEECWVMWCDMTSVKTIPVRASKARDTPGLSRPRSNQRDRRSDQRLR